MIDTGAATARQREIRAYFAETTVRAEIDRPSPVFAGLSLGPVGMSLDRKDDHPPGVEENRLRKVAADVNESARNPTVVLQGWPMHLTNVLLAVAERAARVPPCLRG